MSAPTATTDAVVHAFLDEFTEDTRQYYAPGSREWEYDGNDYKWNSDTDPSAGYIAWLRWGGDAGKVWADRHASGLKI